MENTGKQAISLKYFSECWTTGDSHAPNHHPTRVEKLAALVRLLRSHWTTSEHYCVEYLERVTITDPDLYLVALCEDVPVGTRIRDYYPLYCPFVKGTVLCTGYRDHTSIVFIGGRLSAESYTTPFVLSRLIKVYKKFSLSVMTEQIRYLN